MRLENFYHALMKRLLILAISVLLLTGCSTTMGTIKAGGEWFLNAQNDDFIGYEYDPENSEWADTRHSMREMGALWSITQLWHFLDDERYEELAYRGFSFFEKSFAYDEDGNFIYVNITPDKVKLGYNAFAILTLLELENDNKDNYLTLLANGIIHQQQDSGELKTFFFEDRETGVDYYPGEALLAMMALYDYTGNQNYYNVVNNAFPFYYQYWQDNPNTAFVPWQTQAYYRFYEDSQESVVADYVFSMNDYMVDTYEDFDSSIVTAVYVEGMLKAYMLADELGDSARRLAYANFIRDGIDAVMSMQCKSCEGDGYGGFYGGPNDHTMRVDRNQHAVMALMGAKQLGLVR